MSKTRNNHYVPQWYQEGFFELGRSTIAYLDLTPSQTLLNDGRIITERALFDSPTSRAFRQKDLYSTFFGTSVNDEIERRLFGDIDTRGAHAIRAFAGTDVAEWHRHFRSLFEYIDIQKIRTPKGLDWLKAQYPLLSQNELMLEMQGIRMMHCTIWTEGVREIVSAEEAEVKFIFSDHPVTIYNHAVPPEAEACSYPHDPAITLKASQTIFPLNRNFCLILTNLEYARDPLTKPIDKRTFARNYRNSMVRTDSFIRTRKLTNPEIAAINYVVKARARRYIAAGRKEWLHPEKIISNPWSDLGKALLPPKGSLWGFGGEMYAKFENGNVHYQDEFGRTEKQRKFLKKDLPTKKLRLRDMCGCGSGRILEVCCNSKPIALRPTWKERSIRERNIMLYQGISNVLDLGNRKDWISVRRDLTDEQISTIYLLYESLWPRETDLLQLLPKPDSTARAVYTGSIHPTAIREFALGASLYFGQLIIEHPFVHAGSFKEKYSPVQNPRAYRQEFLKAVIFFLTVMPLVESGHVNLIPDPCDFDPHLREQMLHMATSRSARSEVNPHEDVRLEQLMREDLERSLVSLPQEALRSQLLKASPDLVETELQLALREIDRRKECDPLAVLQEDSLLGGQEGGQFSVLKLAPNFEMAMYLAQATGSSIVTDRISRWREIRSALHRRAIWSDAGLSTLARSIEGSTFAFPQDVEVIAKFASDKTFVTYAALMRDIFRYLAKTGGHDSKPNFEAGLTARFARVHSPALATIRRASIPAKEARIFCAFPQGGIRDNTVNRLLLMSSSERHLPSVPMAFFIEGKA